MTKQKRSFTIVCTSVLEYETYCIVDVNLYDYIKWSKILQTVF